MVRVLVTAAGGFIGLGAVKSLIEYSEHEVVATDMDSDAAGLYIADEAYTIPPANDDTWSDRIGEIVVQEGVEAVIPLLNVEMPHVGELMEAVPEDVPVITPRNQVREIGLDKYRLYEALSEHDIPVPETRLVANVEEHEGVFPQVIKPRRGSASEGVERIESIEDYHDYLAESDRDPQDMILQDFISGCEFTSSVVGTRNDELLTVVVKEAIRKEGGTVRGATRDNPHVQDACSRIFEALSPRGPMNVQQMVDEETGTVYTIEINPRFSASACFTVAAGVNEFDLLVRDALGEHITQTLDYETDLHMIRHRSQMYVQENELL